MRFWAQVRAMRGSTFRDGGDRKRSGYFGTREQAQGWIERVVDTEPNSGRLDIFQEHGEVPAELAGSESRPDTEVWEEWSEWLEGAWVRRDSEHAPICRFSI